MVRGSLYYVGNTEDEVMQQQYEWNFTFDVEKNSKADKQNTTIAWSNWALRSIPNASRESLLPPPELADASIRPLSPGI